jgi:tyrosinase
VSPVAPPGPTQPPAALRHRREIRLLTNAQLADLRRAFSLSQALDDDRGYQYWSGIHGLPLPIYCTHNSPLFFAWHRAYLYFFEKSLQDLVPGVTLPWWDWRTTRAVPAAYRHKEIESHPGQPNPLFDSPIELTGRRDPKEDRTWREPGRDGELPNKKRVAAVLANSDFATFQTQAEDIHGGVHVWVGGTMGDISVAAYDPVFWAHHCMIDRLGRMWQLQHPGAGPSRKLLDRALPPFPMTVRDTLDITHLGYNYAAGTTAVPGPGHAHG